MKLLTNYSGSYLTGDDIADAVMNYGLALTRSQDVDLVDIPLLMPDQSIRRVELLIGWNNQLSSMTQANQHDELLEVDTIVDLYSKTQAVGLIRGEPFTDEELKHNEWPAFDGVV
jgi:hypothetical protein